MQDNNPIGALAPGTLLGSRLRVERTLGRGGFAITYLCRAGQFDKPFAVKEWMPLTLAGRTEQGNVEPFEAEDRDVFEGGLADFVEEGRRLMACHHANIAGVEDYFEENGTAYLVMEYVPGETLRQHLAEHRRLAPEALAEMLRPLGNALHAMHDQGLLHRDITPSNIILRDGKIGQPVLIDFGAARYAGAARTYSISQVCSDGYSPPEQYQSRAGTGPYSDIYALGCVAYRCLTGERPPIALDRMVQDPVNLTSDFIDSSGQLLVPIVSKAIALEPTQRYQSVQEMMQALTRVEETWQWLPQARAAAPTLQWTERTDGCIEVSGDVTSASAMNAKSAALASAPMHITLVDLAGTLQFVEPTTPQRDASASPVARAASRSLPAWGWVVGSAAASVIAALGYYGPRSQEGPIAYRSSPDIPFEVQIELPKVKYKVGDPFNFAVLSNKDCNFLVYTVDAADKVELHDPRVSGAYMGAPVLRAGERRQIPVSGAPGRALINPPSGTYQIGAVCGRDDLAELGIASTQLRKPAQEGKRNFRFAIDTAARNIRRDRLSLATVTYEVE